MLMALIGTKRIFAFAASLSLVAFIPADVAQGNPSAQNRQGQAHATTNGAKRAGGSCIVKDAKGKKISGTYRKQKNGALACTASARR